MNDGSSRREVWRWPWGSRARVRIDELEALLEYEAERAGSAPCVSELQQRAADHLSEAKAAVGSPRRLWLLRAGQADSALANMNAAHTIIIRIAPPEDFRGMLPDIAALVQENLPPNDQHRCEVAKILRSCRNNPDVFQRQNAGAACAAFQAQRQTVAEAARAAYRVQEREVVRVRSFARIVYGWAGGLLGIAIAVAVLGALFDDVVPLCFNPGERVVCPTADGGVYGALHYSYGLSSRPWDYVVIEAAGLVSAAVTGAATLRQIRGTATAYNVPMALAVLKLPTGALTAVLGLLLMRGELVPGLTALDTSAQIIAWAIIFGAAQQLVTRFVDERGNAVMQAVTGPESPRPAAQRRRDSPRVPELD